MCIKSQVNKIVTILSVLLCSVVSLAAQQKGYDIILTTKGVSNTKLILVFYYGDRQLIKDTFKVDGQGRCEIKADTNLPAGIYLAAYPVLGNRYFEFVVNEQRFSLSTDTADMGGDMVISGSLENSLFYDDMRAQSKLRKLAEGYNKEYTEAKNEKKKKAIVEKLRKQDSLLIVRQDSIRKMYPNTFYASILKALKPIQLKTLKDAPRDAKGRIIDSNFVWRDYKDRYWDNIDLKDDRILMTPVYHNKLHEYYTRTIVQMPDSIIDEGDKLLSKMPPKGELFKYTLTYMLNEMAKSQNMGFDAVYVHLVKSYYGKGFTPWVDSVELYKINDRGRALDPLLMGKKAMYLNLADTTLTTYHSLYDLPNRFVILCFWDPDCGHCKIEIPKLIKAYHQMKKDTLDVEVYAAATIASEAEIKKWKDFIKANDLDWLNVADPYRQNNFRYEWDLQSTPQVYILDKDKIIKAKRIGAEQVEDFIKHLMDPKYKPTKTTVVEDEAATEPTGSKK